VASPVNEALDEKQIRSGFDRFKAEKKHGTHRYRKPPSHWTYRRYKPLSMKFCAAAF